VVGVVVVVVVVVERTEWILQKLRRTTVGRILRKANRKHDSPTACLWYSLGGFEPEGGSSQVATFLDATITLRVTEDSALIQTPDNRLPSWVMGIFSGS
jgi:hypothetical protein